MFALFAEITDTNNHNDNRGMNQTELELTAVALEQTTLANQTILDQANTNKSSEAPPSLSPEFK